MNHVTAFLASAVGFGDVSFVFNGIAALCVVGGIFSIWLGYKLFLAGFEKGRAKLQAKLKFADIAFSGMGPGLFFMAFGALILMIAAVAALIGTVGR